MTGEPDYLESTIMQEFIDDPEELRDIVRRVLVFLLGHQYVTVKGTRRLWRVLEGTGMGLIHSGELADLAFYHDFEKPILQNQFVIDSLWIQLYVRFKDDLFIISGGKYFCERTSSLFQSSSTFKVQEEALDFYHMPYLDLVVFKGKHWDTSLWEGNTLDFCPMMKPTSQGLALHPRSHHLCSTHMSWPFAELRRLSYRCSRAEFFHAAKLEFVARLRRYGALPVLVAKLMEFRFLGSKTPDTHRRPRELSGAQEVFVVFSHHPIWEKVGITGAIKSIIDNPYWQQSLVEEANLSLNVRVSWKLEARPHQQRILATNLD